MDERTRWMPMFPNYEVCQHEGCTYHLQFCGDLVRIVVQNARSLRGPIGGFIRRGDLKQCLSQEPRFFNAGLDPIYEVPLEHAWGLNTGTFTLEGKDVLGLPNVAKQAILVFITEYEAGVRLVYRGRFGPIVGRNRHGDRRESYPKSPVTVPDWNESGEESRYGDIYLHGNDGGWLVRVAVMTTFWQPGDDKESTRDPVFKEIALNRDALLFREPYDIAKGGVTGGLNAASAKLIAAVAGGFTDDVLEIFQEHVQPRTILILNGPRAHDEIRCIGVIVPGIHDGHIDFDVHYYVRGRETVRVTLLDLFKELSTLNDYRPRKPVTIPGVGDLSPEAAKALRVLLWGNN